MKTLKIVSCAVLILGFLLSGDMPGAEAATFLGDFCWQSANGVIRLGVTDMGGGHFLVHGRSSDKLTVANGNAEIFGQQVIVIVNFSGEDDSAINAGTGRLVLNLSNLNGTVEDLKLKHDKLDPDPKSAVANHSPPEALTFIPCP